MPVAGSVYIINRPFASAFGVVAYLTLRASRVEIRYTVLLFVLSIVNGMATNACSRSFISCDRFVIAFGLSIWTIRK